MSKYLLQASYSADGLKGLMKDKASGRKAAVERLFASVGGKLESVYYCFGDNDVVLIADVPDDAAMAAASINACYTGLFVSRPLHCSQVQRQIRHWGRKSSTRPRGDRGGAVWFPGVQ